MRTETVEIYSDETNRAVLRHPGRRFPGVLIQGDSLHNLCRDADEACTAVGRHNNGYAEVNDLRNTLLAYLAHYKKTLEAREIELPFNDAT